MIKKLYEEALNAGVFRSAFSLAGFEDTEDVEDLKSIIEEIGQKLDGTPDRNLPPKEYADELVDALYGDAQDLLGVEMIHSLGGEEKALSMTYGEYFAYNKAAQDWLVFLIDRDATEGKTDAEEDAFYNKAEDFLWEDFKKRLALKRG